MKDYKTGLVILWLLSLFFSANIIFGQGNNVGREFAELKAQYLSLRNTDVSLVRAEEWASLAKRFESLVDKNPAFSEAPAALYNASILLQGLYSRFGGQDRTLHIIKLLQRIARDYPGTVLVDDALVKLGDLYLYDLKDIDSAKKAFQEVVEAYPEADMYPVALARIKAIEDGSYIDRGTLAGAKEEFLSPVISSKKVWNGRRPLIVLDPGHGGEDFGAQGVGGLLEKDVVLSIAFQLEKLLTENLGALVRLTRRNDSFVPLATRTQMANDFEADLFISLHINASPQHNAHGIEVYYLDNSDNQASLKMAERENASVKFEGPDGDLQFILSDLIQSAKLDESIILANVLNAKIRDRLSQNWKQVQSLGVKKAPFYVLVGAHMPCVLLEMFFIDHKTDGPRLAQKKFRKDIAFSIFQGISEYISRNTSARS